MAEQDLVLMGTVIYWYREKHYRHMQNAATEALRRYANDPVPKLFCAIGMMMEGRMSDAMRELEMLTSKQDVNLAAVIALIYGHKQARSVDREAVQQLDSKLKTERKQGNERSYYYAGLFLMHQEEYDKAAEYIDRAVKLNQQSKDVLALKGWLELRNGKDSTGRKAAKYFDESLSIEGPKCLDAMFGKAKCCQQLNDFGGAMDMISKAVVMVSNSLPPVIEKMKIQLAMLDWEQTIDTANRAMGMKSSCLQARQYIILHLLCKEGNYTEAASQLEELLRCFAQEEPQNARLLHQFARLFCRVSGQNPLVLQQTYAFQEKAVSLNSGNAELLCELGYQLLSQSRPKDAIKCYQNAYKTDESCVNAVIGIIWCQLMENQVESAVSQFEFLSEVNDSLGKSAEVAYLTALVSVKRNEPQEKIIGLLNNAVKVHSEKYQSMPLGPDYLCALNPSFLLQIAKACMTYAPQQPLTKEQSPDRVLSDCQKILEPLCKAVPGLMEGLYLLGKVRFLSGDVDAASQLIRRCLELDPTWSDSHILMAQIYLYTDNFKMANQSLEQGLSYNFEVRDHPIYLLIKARILKKQGNLDEAVKTLQAAMLLPGVKNFSSGAGKKKVDIGANDCVSLYIELADAHRMRNEQHEAAKVMQDAVNNFKGTSEEVRLTIANVDLMLARGDVEGALGMLRNITPEQTYYVQAQEKMADIYLNHRKDKHLYASCYRELAKKYPSSHSFLMLGDAYMSIQEPEKAIEVYESSLKRNPKDPTMASRIGLALVKTHQFGKAISYYEAAFKQSGQLFLRHDLAQLLLRLKQYDKAEKVLKQFIEQETKGDADALIETSRFLVLLAQVYQQQGRLEDWISTLNRAKETQGKALMRVVVDQPDVAVQQQQFAADVCSKMAQFYLQQRDLQRAIQFYKEAQSHATGDSKVTLELAKLYMLTDDADSCEHLCRMLTKQGQEVDEATMMMADVLMRKNLYEEAVQQFQQLLQSKPSHYGALERLIDLMRRAGRLEGCPAFLELAEKSSGRAALDAGFNYCKGLYEWYVGNPNGALRHFNKARKDAQYGHAATYCMVEICLNPDNETIGGEVFDSSDGERGPTSADKAESEMVGIKTADRLLKELKPKPGSLRHAILVNMVLIATKNRTNIESALASFMQMCNIEKENIGALYGSAVAYMALKDSQKARHQLRNVAKMAWTVDDAEDLEKSWLLLADMSIQAGRTDVAVELLERCLQRNRSCCKAYEYVGHIMEKEQKFKEAMANYEKAWRYGNKNNPTVGYKLAFNYLKAKRIVEAIDVCHQVLAAHPTYPKIRKEILEKARLQLKAGRDQA
jgi:tetratricopeptide repeat protein 21B